MDDDVDIEWLAENVRAIEEGRHPSPSKESKFRREIRKRVPDGCLLVFDDERCNSDKLPTRRPGDAGNMP